MCKEDRGLPGNHAIQQPCNKRLSMQSLSASATAVVARTEAAKRELEVAGMEQGVILNKCLIATRRDRPSLDEPYSIIMPRCPRKVNRPKGRASRLLRSKRASEEALRRALKRTIEVIFEVPMK